MAERLGLRCERFRIDHVGRLGDEVTRKKDCVRRLVERLISALRGTWGSGRYRYAAQRRLLLGLLFGLVLVEAIRFETGAKGQMSSCVGWGDIDLIHIDGEGCLGFSGAVQVSDEVAAELLEKPGIYRGGPPQTGKNDAVHL